MQSISELEKKLEDLPLLPMVVARLLALDTNDENYFEQVLRLSQEDPTFALRIIKLSNSCMSSPVHPIATLRDAIVRLGVKSVAGLVTSMSAIRVFVPTTQGEKNLWVHAIQTAVAARVIAREAKELEVNPEQAYLCGLMHDIGRFVLFDKASEELNLVDEANWESPAELVIVECEQYGFDHAELGGRVCKKWGLIDCIIDVVANHHVYAAPANSPKSSMTDKLVHVIQMADFLSVFMMLNPDIESWDPSELEKALNDKCMQHLGFNPPISAKQLREHSIGILEEANNLSVELGIH